MANFTIYFPGAIQVSIRNFPHRLTQDPEKKAKSLVAEINNGRLAMFAIIGVLPSWLIDDWPMWWLNELHICERFEVKVQRVSRETPHTFGIRSSPTCSLLLYDDC